MVDPAQTIVQIKEYTTCLDEKNNTFVQFKIEVSDSTASWSVNRRYREFEELHAALKGRRDKGLELPGKGLFTFNKNSDEFLRERRAGLENYLIKLIEPSLTDGLQYPEVLDFLDHYHRHSNTTYSVTRVMPDELPPEVVKPPDPPSPTESPPSTPPAQQQPPIRTAIPSTETNQVEGVTTMLSDEIPFEAYDTEAKEIFLQKKSGLKGLWETSEDASVVGDASNIDDLGVPIHWVTSAEENSLFTRENTFQSEQSQRNTFLDINDSEPSS